MQNQPVVVEVVPHSKYAISNIITRYPINSLSLSDDDAIHVDST
jgi:hypothetical protein